MLELALNKPDLNILCLGAHSDDIEIGCGGTLLKLLENRSNVSVTWLVLSAMGERKQEAVNSAEDFLKQATNKTIITKDFRDTFFPYEGEAIKTFFSELNIQPDVVFTHYRHDRHQDHRTISDLTWNRFRNHLTLEYEIPKYDGDMGIPNVYSALPETISSKKLDLLDKHFATQQRKAWYDRDTFQGLMRIRGMESGSDKRFAEAFHGRKLLLS